MDTDYIINLILNKNDEIREMRQKVLDLKQRLDRSTEKQKISFSTPLSGIINAPSKFIQRP